MSRDILETYLQDILAPLEPTCRDTETCLHVSGMFLRTQICSTEATEFLHVGKLLKVRTYNTTNPDQTSTVDLLRSIGAGDQ